MSMEDKFNAAVNVIRSLPKNGSYQPSHEMMLRFYAYFKQATDGHCCGKRPGFWDIVGRAKYDAWKRLGEMPKEKAMESYVDELKKIVETMSYTDNVANFYGSIQDLGNVKLEDLALVAPETINRQTSDPNSPLHSRNHSRFNSRDGSPTRTPQNSFTDTSDEEYIDTVDENFSTNQSETFQRNWKHQNDLEQLNFKASSMPNGGPEITNMKLDQSMITHIIHINDKMKSDLDQVNSKIGILEKKVSNLRHNPTWWPIWLRDVNPYWFAFTIIWPVFVALLFQSGKQRKR